MLAVGYFGVVVGFSQHSCASKHVVGFPKHVKACY